MRDVKIEITPTLNQNLDDFVYINDIRINEHGVICITIKSDKFKYWNVNHGSGANLFITNTVTYKEGNMWNINYDDDEYDDEDNLTETFWFDVILDGGGLNSCYDYECFITPLKWEYEILLIPRWITNVYDNKISRELNWDEVVIVYEDKEDKVGGCKDVI
jgi:hypothetical protein